MKKLGIASILTAAAVAAGSVTAGAKYEPYNSSDGHTLGYYSAVVNEKEREHTQSLYRERPKNERRFEYLTRGAVAVAGSGGTLISWRYLGTDSASLKYNLYCGDEKLNAEPIENSCFFHAGAAPGVQYILKEVENGAETGAQYSVTAWDKGYTDFAVTPREGYIIDDASAADLDGDGEYELILRRVPSMDVKTRTEYPLIEAYRIDGTHMWTIDVGPNEINEVDINFLAYDMNGDGCAELIMRSFEGTTDGAGAVIGDTNKDGITDYSKNESNLAIFKDRQYIISTPEFLSVYDGKTGAELDRTDLKPAREPLSEWSYNYTDTGRLTKRASHYLFGLAYLDGITPSVVMVRGAWDNVRAAAWHMEGGKLVEDWVHNTVNAENADSIYGACNHNLITADVDFDGKDEILSGPMAIDDDGSEMYAVKAYDNDNKPQKLAHGDAFDVAFMTPDYNGYLVWACHEAAPLMANIELHDARTGEVIRGYGKDKDTGRSRAADIDPTHRGFEVWGSTATIPAGIDGENIADEWNKFKFRNTDGTVAEDATIPMNFKVYWDGDLLSELLDGITVSKYNWEDGTIDAVMTAEGCASNGGTKAVPCLCADLFGDWREEIVWKTADEQGIRIYSTAVPTDYKITTLMHDSYYRSCIAVQNNHYNQPANLGYYLGAETTHAPMFEGYVIKDGKKLTNPDLDGKHGSYPIGGSGKIGALSIKLAADVPNAYVGKDIVPIDLENDSVTPVIDAGRTLVPIRFIAESLGMEVLYNEQTREITLKGNGYSVGMTLDAAEYTVNGSKLVMDTAARSENGRTLVPLRAAAEAVGRNVEWNAENRLIYIGMTQFYDRDRADFYAAALKSGKEPEPTPVPEPTSTPNPADTAEYTLFTDENNTEWRIYFNEDFESFGTDENPGWAGTNKPGAIEKIAVAENGGKVLQIGGSAKGSRNAIYHLPFALQNNVRIELDWKTGECVGGASYGELRFADSARNTFFALKTKAGEELQYSANGGIANGNLESDWNNVGKGFNRDTVYHIVIEADFEKKICNAIISDGTKKAEINNAPFDAAVDFKAIEVLAVRVEKNFTWETELDNIKLGMH